METIHVLWNQYYRISSIVLIISHHSPKSAAENKIPQPLNESIHFLLPGSMDIDLHVCVHLQQTGRGLIINTETLAKSKAQNIANLFGHFFNLKGIFNAAGGVCDFGRPTL
jgi:hypothetical protein